MTVQERCRRTVARGLGVVVVAVLTAVTTALPAGAHAEFVSSTPRSGATVQRLPGSVTLTFSEPVRTPAFVEITAPGGDDVSMGKAQLRDADVVQRLGDAAGAGDYAMSYRVTSTDGHPISGTVRFTLAGGGSGGQDQDGQSQAGQGQSGQGGQGGKGGQAEADGATSAEETAPVTAPGDTGGGIGSLQLVLLLAALALGLAALGVGTRRALRHSVAMVDDGKRGRSRRT